MRHRGKAAYTLFEVLMVAALMALIVATLFKGSPRPAGVFEVESLAQSLAAELRSAASRAKIEDYPVAVVIPSGGGSAPHSQSFYFAEGPQARVTSVRSFSGDFPKAAVAAGLIYPDAVSTIDAPLDGGNGASFDLVTWLEGSSITSDYVICFTPSGQVVTNNLPVVNGSYKLLVGTDLRYQSGATPSGAGWALPSSPSYYRITECGSAKILSISSLGTVDVVPLDPNTGIVSKVEAGHQSAPVPPPSVPAVSVNTPQILAVEIYPEPVLTNLPPGIEAAVDIDHGELSLRVLAEDSDSERRLFCRWESDNGGPFSKADWHPMSWNSAATGPGLGAWESSVTWELPPGTADGDEFVLTAEVRDEANNTVSRQLGTTGRVLAIDPEVIVFKSNRENFPVLYQMTPEGGEVRQIGSNIYSHYDHVVSPDGTRVFYTKSNELYLTNVETGSELMLCPNSVGGIGKEPTGMTEDATRIFWSGVGPNIFTDFWLMTARMNGAGTVTPYVLNNDPGFGFSPNALYPSLSPDERKLAWMNGTTYRLRIGDWNPGGPPFLPGAPVATRTAGGGNVSSLVWSPVMETGPDRRRIFFQDGSGPNQDIYSLVIDYSTNESFNNDPPQRLTNFNSRMRGVWPSPDGDEIVFSSDHSGNYEIYRMNADGTGAIVNITNDPGNDESPSWGR